MLKFEASDFVAHQLEPKWAPTLHVRFHGTRRLEDPFVVSYVVPKGLFVEIFIGTLAFRWTAIKPSSVFVMSMDHGRIIEEQL